MKSDLVDEMFEGWLPGAMFPSELAWLERAIRKAEVDVVIECGRQDGVSTWSLARLLADTGVEILSIDFDDDAERLRRAQTRLQGLRVTCVSGDIHEKVPVLLDQQRDRVVAVVQDGPKGWEGMATLLAAAHRPQVRLIAQHNLHRGHVSRTAFEMLALRPAFLEDNGPDAQLLELRRREEHEIPERAPNRPVDHTSLGVIELDDPARAHLLASIEVLRDVLAPWDPMRVVAAWDSGDIGYVSRLRSRQRFSRHRRKPR